MSSSIHVFFSIKKDMNIRIDAFFLFLNFAKAEKDVDCYQKLSTHNGIEVRSLGRMFNFQGTPVDILGHFTISVCHQTM